MALGMGSAWVKEAKEASTTTRQETVIDLRRLTAAGVTVPCIVTQRSDCKVDKGCYRRRC